MQSFSMCPLKRYTHKYQSKKETWFHFHMMPIHTILCRWIPKLCDFVWISHGNKSFSSMLLIALSKVQKKEPSATCYSYIGTEKVKYKFQQYDYWKQQKVDHFPQQKLKSKDLDPTSILQGVKRFKVAEICLLYLLYLLTWVNLVERT